ncbi:glycosyltransferase [Micromonospora sp. NPDC049679]|uniref:glycosyltransferase n=1 Tax=Micromonospora sp. NPDC049679 TaxID=3155920 RepID=UPI0033C108AA
MAGLRIAVIAQPNRGGMWIPPLAEELRRRGHEVTVVLPPPPAPGELTNALTGRRFPVIAAPLPDRLRPVRLWRLRQTIRGLGVDVVYYHPYAVALAIRLATLGMRVRRVHRVDGALHLDSPASRRLERLLWRMDHATICCTEHVSARYGKLGCPADRRPVAYAGTNLARFRPSWAPRDRYAGSPARAEARAKARAEIGVDEHVFLVVLICYVYPPRRSVYRGRCIKGHDVLLEAWSTFHARHPRSHLLIVGGGVGEAGEAHRAELVERFAVVGNPSVTWLDSLPDVRPYYRAADVNVSPARGAGSSGAVREASAMSVPSIVSDADGLPEALDEADGWVVPRGDAVALATALDVAYEEFESDRLAIRGDQARRRAVRLFDDRVAAIRVADIIERTASAVPTR